MEVVLLQRVESLGQMGDVVTVKPGFARNFLIPRKKALRATKENIAYFESQRKTLETMNLNSKKDAEKAAEKMSDLTVSIIRQAAESGKLYGSVSTRDIADAVNAQGFKTNRDQYTVNQALKMLGLFPVTLNLHPEVAVKVTVNIARTEEEAKIQKERGTALVKSGDDNQRDSSKDVNAKPADEQPDVDPNAFLETKSADAA